MAARTTASRSPDPGIAEVAALIGEPARAAMLCALLEGAELAAGELAAHARLAASAASAHLSKLTAGGLIVARTAGRQRLFRLAGADVARAVEALLVIAPPVKVVALAQSHVAHDLRAARSCYDHLAGRLGVAVTEALVARGSIAAAAGGEYRLTAPGAAFLQSAGVDVAAAREARRHFARQCLDWSERRPHLAGALGAALRAAFLARGWIVRKTPSRALRVTPAGREWLVAALAVDLDG
jgi:DNA-binding transcriptional ArsR family regulator